MQKILSLKPNSQTLRRSADRKAGHALRPIFAGRLLWMQLFTPPTLEVPSSMPAIVGCVGALLIIVAAIATSIAKTKKMREHWFHTEEQMQFLNHWIRECSSKYAGCRSYKIIDKREGEKLCQKRTLPYV